MNIKKKIGMAVMAGATMVATPVVSAEGFMDDVKFVPQLGFSVRHLRFEQTFTLPGVNNKQSGDFDVDIPSLTGSLTVVKGKAYISVKMERSIDDEETKTSIPWASSGGDENSDIDREDISVTLGYNIWNSANIFVGYLEGETRVEPYGGSGPFSAGSPGYEQEYKEDGWFLGGSYSWAFEMGTLSFSAAYADLDATYQENNLIGVNPFKYEGDADGLSYGLNWSAPLSERVGYYIDLRRQSYEFDGEDKTGNYTGWSVENKEVITALSAGLQWYF